MADRARNGCLWALIFALGMWVFIAAALWAVLR